MGLSQRQYTREFKLAAVRRLESGVSLGVLARELEVSPNLLHRWRSQYRESPEKAFPGKGNPHSPESGIAALERKIGQQAVEIDFLKACLQRIERQRMLQASTGSPRSTARSTQRSSAQPEGRKAR